MDASLLRKEIQLVQKGRGIRRAGVAEWIGPNLKRLIQWDHSMSEAEARSRLVTLLRSMADALPTDLNFLFLAAAGITSAEPFLSERLAKAAVALHREPRTLARYLRTAESLMAAGVEHRNPEPRSPYATFGWQWTEFEIDVALGRPDPVFTTRRQLTATVDGLDHFKEVIATPAPPMSGKEPQFIANFGCEVISVERPSSTSWIATVALPRPLPIGGTHDLGLTNVLPSRDAIRPFAVVAPIRPCRRGSVRVDFGSPSVAADAWSIEGIPSTVLDEPQPDAARFNPRTQRVVHQEFFNPLVGLCYGVGWTWADGEAG